MKIRHILIASSALAFGPAIAQETVAPQSGSDCASLQAQYDQAAPNASAEQLSAAKAARDEGERLCAAGNTAEGSAKLQEALSAISQPSRPSQVPAEQLPVEQPPTEQAPTDTEHPPQ